ncbi:MAG: UrcA family protein [Hyphomonas sp.]
MIRPLIAAALAVSLATPAFASSSDEFRIRVDYDAAALETTKGAATEFDRIKTEISERCAEENDFFGVHPDFVVNVCENRAMRQTVRAIDHPNFTAAYIVDQSK